MKRVTIFTDGGCEGNPGPGGWAAILRYESRAKEISGGALATTNNRMELQAAISALRTLREPCEIEFVTDSQYLREGITKWVAGWKRRGWMLSTKKPVKNDDLWRQLDMLVMRHRMQWRWVRGHSGHFENERCDQLAQAEIAALKQKHPQGERQAALEQFLAARDSRPATASLFGDDPARP